MGSHEELYTMFIFAGFMAVSFISLLIHSLFYVAFVLLYCK